MRLDHLLSRESAKVETPELILRSITAKAVNKEPLGSKKNCRKERFSLYRFQGSYELKEPPNFHSEVFPRESANRSESGVQGFNPCCSLTTAYE